MKTLTLKPGAFNSELLPIVGIDRINWPSEEHLRLVEGVLPRLTTTDGASATLTGPVVDLIRHLVRPTEGGARKCLKDALAHAGYVLDEETERIFVLLLSSQQFADFLAKTINPQTGKPFIVKEKKRGAKKSTFASLITAAPPVVEPPPAATVPESVVSDEPANTGNASDDAVEVEITEILPPPPKVTPAKPTTK